MRIESDRGLVATTRLQKGAAHGGPIACPGALAENYWKPGRIMEVGLFRVPERGKIGDQRVRFAGEDARIPMLPLHDGRSAHVRGRAGPGDPRAQFRRIEACPYAIEGRSGICLARDRKTRRAVLLRVDGPAARDVRRSLCGRRNGFVGQRGSERPSLRSHCHRRHVLVRGGGAVADAREFCFAAKSNDRPTTTATVRSVTSFAMSSLIFGFLSFGFSALPRLYRTARNGFGAAEPQIRAASVARQRSSVSDRTQKIERPRRRRNRFAQDRFTEHTLQTCPCRRQVVEDMHEIEI